ncbi:MAG TPA: hypothetical protein VLG28_14435 [Acidimicrobiia bacterium]|nr:hypothetical protein [Acidimicrobiia bacterium]
MRRRAALMLVVVAVAERAVLSGQTERILDALLAEISSWPAGHGHPPEPSTQ